MAYVQIPKDLSAVKTKVFLGLTKRQLICFGIAAIVGIPTFFLLRKPLGNTTAAFILVAVTIPAFLFALYEKNGMPLEKYLKIMIQARFIRPRKRPYRTNNYYSGLELQGDFYEEVTKIVDKAESKDYSGKAINKE